MATVGHTLVGLFLSGVSPAKARDGALLWVWPGLVIALAHLVDVVEWIPAALHWRGFTSRFLTHSPALTGGVVLVVWAALALCRVRRPVLYGIAALAVFSHLVLDSIGVRGWIYGAYGLPPAQAQPGQPGTVVAELWLLGLPWILLLLVHAGRRGRGVRGTRAAAVVLALACIAAALTRKPVLWLPLYGFALFTCGALFRRELDPRLLWGLAPLLPVALFIAVEAQAMRLWRQAGALRRQGDCVAVVQVLERLRALPTRSRNRWLPLSLGSCYQELGLLREAESTLLEAQARWKRFEGPTYYLALLYADPRSRNTPLFRPEEAERLLRSIDSEPFQTRARRLLEQWSERERAEGSG